MYLSLECNGNACLAYGGKSLIYLRVFSSERFFFLGGKCKCLFCCLFEALRKESNCQLRLSLLSITERNLAPNIRLYIKETPSILRMLRFRRFYINRQKVPTVHNLDIRLRFRVKVHNMLQVLEPEAPVVRCFLITLTQIS